MRHTYLILHLLFFTISCSEKQTNSNIDIDYLTIPITIKEESISIEEIADSIKYIPLSNEILIKDVQKMLMDKNGHFYLSDSDNNGIFKFDNRGNYICQISKKGQGPGEYYRIKDFDIDNDKIIINSGGKDLHYYDTNGNFIKSFRHEENATFLAIHNDTICQSECRRLKIFINNKINKFNFEDENCFLLYDHRNHFTKNGNLIFWEDAFNDTIYQIKNGKPIPFLYIDFKELKLPDNIIINDEILNNPIIDRYCTNISEFRISDDFITFFFSLSKRIKFCIYNRNNNKSHIASKISNNIDFIPITPIPLAINKNKIYFVTDGMSIYYQYMLFKEHNTDITLNRAKKIEAILKKIPEEMDNPVIIEVTLKQKS